MDKESRKYSFLERVSRNVVVHYIFDLATSIVAIFVAALIGVLLVKALGIGVRERTFFYLNPWENEIDLVESIILATCCVVAGRLLFGLRQKWRTAYGFLELGAAFGFAMEALQRNPDVRGAGFELAMSASILGAIYVAVRAFDNIDQAKISKSKARAELAAKNFDF